jgi:hypothetical protein
MKAGEHTISCIGCGARVPATDGPTHKYLGTSPGCWQIFGDVLAKEFGNPLYMKVHRLTVDAYALQHLGTPGAQTIQSMNVHLLGLCAALNHGIDYDFIPKIMNNRLAAYKKGRTFTWLTPPSSLGTITVIDVVQARNPDAHSEIVHAWATDVWQQWQPHHAFIEGIYA